MESPPTPVSRSTASPSMDTSGAKPERSAEQAPEVIVEPEDNYKGRKLKARDAFEKGLDPDFLAKFTDYKHVEVLLLSWAKKYDDLQVSDEVQDLKKVFEDLYGFNCVAEEIEPTRTSTAHAALTSIISSWARARDFQHERTLFIVYFAGHGKAQGEDLILHPKKELTDLEHQDKIVWNEIESFLLKGVKADVLQIFDCCFAGSIGKPRSPDHRRMEYLAASKLSTKGPGVQSFTSALIWALEAFAKVDGIFTTVQLLEKIKKAPFLPPRQVPLLSDRHTGSDDGRLQIRKLCNTHLKASALESESFPEGSTDDVVTLKFVCGSNPEEELEGFARSLCGLVHHKKFSIKRILWVDMCPKAEDGLHNAVRAFRSLSRRRSNASEAARPALSASVVTETLSRELHSQHDRIEALEDQTLQSPEVLWRLHGGGSRLQLALLIIFFSLVLSLLAAVCTTVGNARSCLGKPGAMNRVCLPVNIFVMDSSLFTKSPALHPTAPLGTSSDVAQMSLAGAPAAPLANAR